MAIKMADIVARVTSQTEYSNLLAGDQFGFKSAKQYGAVGDGVTDDSAAILSLISAVSSSTSKSLYFPAGVYKVDNVTLKSTQFNGYYLLGDNASFTGITKDIEQIGYSYSAIIGDLSDLNTTDKSSIVNAINELEAESVAGVLTTRGDIITRSSSGTIRVATGTPLQSLVAGNTSDATPLKYIDSPQKVLTTAGDLLYANAANSIDRVGIGTTLQNLSVNATTNGFSYIDSPQKVMTTIGDLIYCSTPNKIARVGIGTALQNFSVNSSTNGFSYLDSVQKIMTTQGDMIYASTANTVTRLAKGTALQALRMNSGATAPEWYTPVQIAEGSYTGDSTNDRTISLGFTPKFVYVQPAVSGARGGFGATSNQYGISFAESASPEVSSEFPTDTNNPLLPRCTTNGFKVSGTVANSLNYTGYTYYYFAIA